MENFQKNHEKITSAITKSNPPPPHTHPLCKIEPVAIKKSWIHPCIWFHTAKYETTTSSSSYIVQTPSGVYSYCRSAVQELSTVDLKTWPKCMYSAVKNIQYFLSHDDWLDFPLEAVDGRAAYYWLGKAVPESDGVRWNILSHLG